MTDDAVQLQRARRQVAALKGFYIHLFVFVCVMIGLFAINAVTATAWWAHWPLLGWGVGVVGHAIAIRSPAPRFAKDWEERKIREQLAKTVPSTAAGSAQVGEVDTPRP